MLPRPILAVLSIFLAGAMPAAAQEADWPCIQRLVPEIAPGVAWPGPPLPAAQAPWATDGDVAALAAKIADRGTPAAVIEQEVTKLAGRFGGDVRRQKLGLLFTGALEILNGDRQRVIADILRFARGQRQLAERVATTTKELETTTDATKIAELRTQRDWDLRVFDDRHKTLSLVCEQPVLLEQHAFTLGRIIAAETP